MTSTNKPKRIALCLILLFTALGITLANATTENNYKNDTNLLPRISESTLTENGYKANIIINPYTTGIYAKENDFNLDLTINPQGIGGSHNENNYQLDLIPEKTFPDIQDLAVTNVLQWFKGQVMNESYHTWLTNVTVTVLNNAITAINYTMNAYYYNTNATYLVATQTATDLLPGETRTLTITCNLTSLNPGKKPGVYYNLKTNANTIDFLDSNPANNEFAYGQVKVRRWGDVDNSDAINILDLKKVKLAYSNIIVEPFADLDGNCNVNILDVKLMKLIYSGLL